MNKTFKLVALLFAFSILVSPVSFAFGQAATAVISGTVVDPSGAAVPGAEVTIENSSLGLTRKVLTTNAGVFTSPDLSPASGYTVTVAKEGFTNYTVNTFSLSVGQQLGLNVTLAIAGAGAEVSVTGEAPPCRNHKNGRLGRCEYKSD